MRNMPQVPVSTIDLFFGCWDRDVVLSRVLDGILSRPNLPLAPGRNHLHFRSQGLVGELEPDLVVPFACAAVRQRIATCPFSHLYLGLSEQGTGNGGTQQVFVLVDGTRTNQWPQVVFNKLVP